MSDEVIDVLERQYMLRLEHRCKAWSVKHPEEARQIREEVAAKFGRTGKPAPEPGTLSWHVLEEAVNEAIRAKKGWPTVRQFLLEQDSAAPTIPSRPPMKPAVDVVDHKSIAANDR